MNADGKEVVRCPVCRENDGIYQQNKRLTHHENDIKINDGKQKCKRCPYRFFPHQLIGLRGEPVGTCAVCRENDKIGKQNKRLRDHDGNNMDIDDDGNQTSSERPRNKKSRDHDDNDTECR